jgi:hypothetical protein
MELPLGARKERKWGEERGCREMPQAAGKGQKRGLVEQLPFFGVVFSPQSSRSRSKSRSTINSRTFPAAAAPSYLAVAGEDL